VQSFVWREQEAMAARAQLKRVARKYALNPHRDKTSTIANRDIEVVQYRIGVHKGIAAVLEAFPTSGGDEEARLRWLAHRAIAVLRTDRFLSVEKVRQVEEIASDESTSAAARLVKLEQHMRARLIEGRYLLP
jgi:hypothetical protein